MSSFLRLLVAAIAVFGLASTSALAVLKVEGRSATFAWDPAAGPVDHYAVHVARSGGKFKYQIESRVSQPSVTVSGQYEERLKLRVTACTAGGACSKPSKDSPKIQFVDPNATKDDNKAAKQAEKAAKQAAKRSPLRSMLPTKTRLPRSSKRRLTPTSAYTSSFQGRASPPPATSSTCRKTSGIA